MRPLTKRNAQGRPYTRRAVIDSSIAQALGAAPVALRTRATIASRSDAEYLDSEVLVYLIRHALRLDDPGTYNALLTALGSRVARNLRRTVRPTKLFSAADVHEETVSQLFELFAEDLREPAAGILDFYEVHFNQAFAALRASVIRQALSRSAPGKVALEPLPDLENDVGSDSVEWAALARTDSNPELSADGAELMRMIQALPLEERQAIMGKYLFGYKVESTDPEEPTVASLCEVSGREIRSRLALATARLKRMKEQS